MASSATLKVFPLQLGLNSEKNHSARAKLIGAIWAAVSQPSLLKYVEINMTDGIDWETVADEGAAATAHAHGRLSEAASSLERTYRQASEDATKLMSEAREQAVRSYAQLENQIREQPVLGLGMGVIIGMVVTLALSNNNRTVVIRERGRYR